MSTLQVANVWFESTANNRVQYSGDANALTITSTNTINFVGGTTNAISVNSTSVFVQRTLAFNNNYTLKTTSLTAGNNHNVNCALGNYFVITCNSSAQNVYFTSAPSGVVYSMTLRFANGSGGNTISWANTPKWPAATAPSPSTNNDIWIFMTDDGGLTWRGNLVQKDSR